MFRWINKLFSKRKSKRVRWTVEEDDTLLRMLSSKTHYKLISYSLGRTIGACKNRAFRLKKEINEKNTEV